MPRPLPCRQCMVFDISENIDLTLFTKSTIMKKLLSMLLLTAGLSLSLSAQDSMNKKMENKTDKMNKKMENKTDKMNKKIENTSEDANKQADTLVRKATPKARKPKTNR